MQTLAHVGVEEREWELEDRCSEPIAAYIQTPRGEWEYMKRYVSLSSSGDGMKDKCWCSNLELMNSEQLHNFCLCSRALVSVESSKKGKTLIWSQTGRCGGYVGLIFG